MGSIKAGGLDLDEVCGGRLLLLVGRTRMDTAYFVYVSASGELTSFGIKSNYDDNSPEVVP